MHLYLVRHADSQASENGLAQSPDTPLSKKGKKQALLLAKRLNQETIDSILSSNWSRGQETAEIISKQLDMKFSYRDDLYEKEQSQKLYGIAKSSDIYLNHTLELQDNLENLDWKFMQEGESFRDLITRCNNLKKSLETLKSDTLVVSHGILLRSFILTCLLPENSIENVFMHLFRKTHLDNASISILEKDDSGWKLTLFNDTSHLRG